MGWFSKTILPRETFPQGIPIGVSYLFYYTEQKIKNIDENNNSLTLSIVPAYILI